MLRLPVLAALVIATSALVPTAYADDVPAPATEQAAHAPSSFDSKPELGAMANCPHQR